MYPYHSISNKLCTIISYDLLSFHENREKHFPSMKIEGNVHTTEIEWETLKPQHFLNFQPTNCPVFVQNKIVMLNDKVYVGTAPTQDRLPDLCKVLGHNARVRAFYFTLDGTISPNSVTTIHI